jgi:hypothetical protein
MRIVYLDKKNPEETAALADAIARIDAWWVDFAARAESLAQIFRTGRPLGDIPDWMTRWLRLIVPHVCWEFGPALQTKGFRLVITCEAEHARRPLVSLLLSRAPVLEGWEFYQYRPAESLALAEQTVRGRTGGTLANVTFTAAAARFNRIDVTLHRPSWNDPEDERALLDARIAVETLLGEETLQKWIGAIAVGPAGGGAGENSTRENLPLDELKKTADGMIADIRARLPPGPRCDRTHPPFLNPPYFGYQFNPHPADDYVGRRGIITLNTREPDVMRAALKARPFFSETFSSVGETFCYLKIDGKIGLQPKRRAELEEALEKLLSKAGVGCVLGGAMGLRYSYIDLALVNVEEATKLMFPMLRKRKIARRSWILFLDSSLASEWIGVYPTSPEPALPVV